jgi:hypothetical protein
MKKREFVLKRVIINYVSLFEGLRWNVLQEYVYNNLGVGIEEFRRTFLSLKREKLLRTRRFKGDIHNFMFVYIK